MKWKGGGKVEYVAAGWLAADEVVSRHDQDHSSREYCRDLIKEEKQCCYCCHFHSLVGRREVENFAIAWEPKWGVDLEETH